MTRYVHSYNEINMVILSFIGNSAKSWIMYYICTNQAFLQILRKYITWQIYWSQKKIRQWMNFLNEWINECIFYPICFVVICQMSVKSNNIWILYWELFKPKAGLSLILNTKDFSIYKFYNEDILKEPVNVLLYSKITKQFDDDKLFLAENENNRKLNKKFYNPD